MTFIIKHVVESQLCWASGVSQLRAIDQFRYIKIQPKTIDLKPKLLGIKPTNSEVIPMNLVLRSIVFMLNFNISKFVTLCCSLMAFTAKGFPIDE